MRTDQTDTAQTLHTHILTSTIAPTDLSVVKIEKPSSRRSMQCLQNQTDDDSKPLNEYMIRIHTQKGHDDLIQHLQNNPDDLPEVTQLDIAFRDAKIDLETIFGSFQGINELFLESNKNLSMTELMKYPNLDSLILSELNIYWNQGEKEELQEKRKGLNLTIYLGSFSYSFDHLSNNSFRMLTYLMNALIFLTTCEFSYAHNYPDLENKRPNPERLPVTILCFILLRFLIACDWAVKDSNESLEKIRIRKE